MLDVRLSALAARDLEEIDDFTHDRFGVTQALRLRARFESMLEQLATFPEMAPLRPEYDPPGRRFRYCTVGSFLIVYRVRADRLEVARILHGSRDMRHVEW
ncbi:MAG: type II toxin-antitoxin system RelE/ParE family toxin [Acidobacteriota bacterium]